MWGLSSNYTVHSMPSYPAQKLRAQIYSSHFLKGMLPSDFLKTSDTHSGQRGKPP
jgi:hypothetical protein